MSLILPVLQLGNIISFAQNGSLPTPLLILFVALGLLMIIVLAAVISFLVFSHVKNNRVLGQKIESKPVNGNQGKKQKEKSLPVGTVLKEGLYVVEEFISASDGLYTYRVKRTDPLYLCSHCHSKLENDTSAFCRVCGASLGITPPTYPEYLLKSSAIGSAFTTAERLIGMNLSHPSLILPVEIFEDSTLGSSMQYLLEPFDQDPKLINASIPMPVDSVMNIGVELAEGLAYLHNYSAVLKNLDPLWVSYHNNTARWIIFDNLHLLTSEEEADYTIQFSDNVRALVMLLHNLLIGPASSSPEVVLPDEIREVLAHYSNPNESVTADKLVRSLRQANRMLGGHNEVKYRLGAKSDVGRIRKLNEDSMVHHDLTSLFEGLNVSVVIASVADGVGGHAAGDIASQLTVSTIESYIDELPEDIRLTHIPEAREWIIKAANAANEKVYQERKAAGNNMACTLVLAFFTGDMATILNVGDSRAYLLNKRGIRQITTDHSLVERLVSIGEITREEARHHPRKSVIYRVIGDRLNLDYDIFDQTFVPGEALLICSDGLTDMVEDATIWRIWRAASSPQEATEQLVAEANTAGGTDNITVIIVEIAP